MAIFFVGVFLWRKREEFFFSSKGDFFFHTTSLFFGLKETNEGKRRKKKGQEVCSTKKNVLVNKVRTTAFEMTEVLVHQQLGSGSFGRVYLVQVAGKWRAMKMLNTDVDVCLTTEQLSEINASATLGRRTSSLVTPQLCWSRFFIASDTALYTFMDYVPWTLKDLRPYLADLRPGNEYSDLLEAAKCAKTRYDNLSDSQRAEDDEVAEDMDYTPEFIAPGTRLCFEGVVIKEEDDDDAIVRFHLATSVRVTEPGEEEEEEEDVAAAVVKHPQQAAWDEMLRRALEPCHTKSGWNAFCWSVGLQLTQAVCDLESRGLVHSDLKSSNIGVMVEERAGGSEHEIEVSRGFVSNGVVLRLVALDLGATRMLHRAYNTNSLPTPRCCPVELLVARKPRVKENLKVDIWAVGAMWGSIFCGRTFFHDETPALERACPGMYELLFGQPKASSSEVRLLESEREFRSTSYWMHVLLVHRGLASFNPDTLDLTVLEPESTDKLLANLPAYATDIHPDTLRFWARTLTYHASDRVTARTLLREMLSWTRDQRHETDVVVVGGDEEMKANDDVVDSWDDAHKGMAQRRAADWSDRAFVSHWRDRMADLDTQGRQTNLSQLLGDMLPAFVDGPFAASKLENCLSHMCDEMTLLATIDLYGRAVVSAKEDLPPLQMFIACLLLVFRSVRMSETWTLSGCFSPPCVGVKQALLRVLACVDGNVDVPSWEHAIQDLAMDEAIADKHSSDIDVDALTRLTSALALVRMLQTDSETQTSTPTLAELVQLAALVLRPAPASSDEEEEEEEEDDDTQNECAAIRPTDRQQQLCRELSQCIRARRVFLERFVHPSFATKCHTQDYRELAQSLDLIAASLG